MLLGQQSAPIMRAPQLAPVVPSIAVPIEPLVPALGGLAGSGSSGAGGGSRGGAGGVSVGTAAPAPAPAAPQPRRPQIFAAGGILAVPAPFRPGYGDYLRNAGFGQVAAVALSGVTGILVLTGAGGMLGYRQARAGHVVRTGSRGRFLS